MSTPIQDEQMIAHYLFTKLPRSLSAAYKTLVKLKYPITDKQSFAAQLEGLGGPNQEPAKNEVSAVDLIRGSFGVFDFPIDSPQSALEKFDGKILEPRGGDFPDPSSREFLDTPSAAETYARTFGPGCAAFATQAFSDSLRSGAGELGATLAGYWDGKKCQDNLGDFAGPCFDVALRAYLGARRSGSTDPQAWAAGHAAGVRCSSFPVPHLPPPIPPR